MSPCPCGHLGSAKKGCLRKPSKVARYQGKLCGPLLDGINLSVEVLALPAEALLVATPVKCNARVNERVVRARHQAMERRAKPDRALQGWEIDAHCAADDATFKILQTVATSMGFSARGTHRTLKLARPIADLAGASSVQAVHVAEAIQYRRAMRAAH